MQLNCLILSVLTAIAAAANVNVDTASKVANPAPPALQFLYTSYVTLSDPIELGDDPNGLGLVIPITGGNFTGPNIKGTILNLGADWGTLSNGTFYPDTRYHFTTSDNAQVFVHSEGYSTITGMLHLRFKYVTGSSKYYWLNKVTAIGVGSQLSPTLLHIDAFTIAGEQS